MTFRYREQEGIAAERFDLEVPEIGLDRQNTGLQFARRDASYEFLGFLFRPNETQARVLGSQARRDVRQ